MAPARSVAGSVLVILGGLLILTVGVIVASLLNGLVHGFGVGNSFLTGVLYFGPVLGLIVVIVGILALIAPSLNILWGILAIIISILSIFTTALGGVFLGFILVLIGAILIMVKRAPRPAPVMHQMGVPPPPPS